MKIPYRLREIAASVVFFGSLGLICSGATFALALALYSGAITIIRAAGL